MTQDHSPLPRVWENEDGTWSHSGNPTKRWTRFKIFAGQGHDNPGVEPVPIELLQALCFTDSGPLKSTPEASSQKPKHSPIPWVVTGTFCDYVASGQKRVCSLENSDFSEAEDRANAALIVKAVNRDSAFDDLVKALEDAEWALNNMSAILDANKIESTLDDPRPAIRAALAKAKAVSA